MLTSRNQKCIPHRLKRNHTSIERDQAVYYHDSTHHGQAQDRAHHVLPLDHVHPGQARDHTHPLGPSDHLLPLGHVHHGQARNHTHPLGLSGGLHPRCQDISSRPQPALAMDTVITIVGHDNSRPPIVLHQTARCLRNAHHDEPGTAAHHSLMDQGIYPMRLELVPIGIHDGPHATQPVTVASAR